MPKSNFNPTKKAKWVPDNNPSKTLEPTTSQQNQGWVREEKPPFQLFNGTINLIGRWLDRYIATQSYNVVIGVDPDDEPDFTTLAANIGAGANAGDNVLVKTNETVNANITIPSGVRVHFLPGTNWSVETVLSDVLTIASDAEVTGTLKINLNATGTFGNGVTFSSDRGRAEGITVDPIIVGADLGSVVAVSGRYNRGRIIARNSGASTISNIITDSSGGTTNDVQILSQATNQVIRAGGFSHDHSSASEGGVLLGQVVQTVVTQDGALKSGTSVIPIDDSFPQNTEGISVLSATITPKSATDFLRVQASLVVSASAALSVVCALFRDSGVNAVRATASTVDVVGGVANITLEYFVIAGSTASTTFTVRIGPSSGGTVRMNGDVTGTRIFQGNAASTLTVYEVRPN